ncbi:MAG: hypothetical protein JGK17_31255 [Microcoleus sp. PH2017_10_PVI_O_A]|uniref:hypothetical protein n=1 Tax=unclassified Microcoleus TaxID=2642155 RepID=UPI001D886BB0|nr:MULTISPECIES: hypothetical protein [unclassified Microcoleus]TAE73579.1 MAG: hypothetical protein EAZ83_31335 [Oscillatoriales cyanobacterium]MCC3409936.1 hypothetical protein [Microcoleus sp. PH2017_10_PVI_O_A]MCC3464184.1 hypothetical protein [Microcoleus sp. PH2017_11_PCY_U_A]MCC3482529.1 hypothetical protein [Microcoleus sp. PH2017_12_PCY_D_A]MCC3532353.1 hypothetical protein [Microcoleus sp. PH2017_21_RUC_O_A]
MLQIEASTPKLTANTSIISDITEDLPLAKSTSNHSFPPPPETLLTTNETSSTSSIELLRSNNKILDKSPEIYPNKQTYTPSSSTKIQHKQSTASLKNRKQPPPKQTQ